MISRPHRPACASVAIHLIGPEEPDLVPPAAMEGEQEGARFAPQATALVFNEALGTRPEFARVLQHSVIRKAIERGAVPVWFPKLSPAAIRLVDAPGLHPSRREAGGRCSRTCLAGGRGPPVRAGRYVGAVTEIRAVRAEIEQAIIAGGLDNDPIGFLVRAIDSSCEVMTEASDRFVEAKRTPFDAETVGRLSKEISKDVRRSCVRRPE